MNFETAVSIVSVESATPYLLQSKATCISVSNLYGFLANN